MKKISLSTLAVVFSLLTTAQEVVTFGNEKVSLDEFTSVFYKNNNKTEITKEYLDNYMDLFINFKLKVTQASELGLDTLATFTTELDGYRKQLAKPYLKNKEFDQNMLLEAYERMQSDIKASHILINLNEKSTVKEEKEALAKIMAIRDEINSGKITFAAAAKKYSDDKSALKNEGNLGYFTAFMMVYNFETVAYNTEVGKISNPVKTKYGYHLINVVDKRKASGQVKVAHIMFKTGEGADKVKLDEAENKINHVAELLEKGESFSAVAGRFSEDKSTATKGGVLPAFGVGKMVPEFELAAFNLKEIGGISAPFRTDYGWHIITLLERQEIPSFEDVKVELKKKIERDSRGDLSKQALYEQLRNSYKVSNKPKSFSKLRKVAHSPLALGKLEKESIKNTSTTLFTIDGNKTTVGEYVDYLVSNQIAGSDFDNMYTNFVNLSLLAYEESKLEEKYPEYKMLLKEYREGILLFDLTNDKVWEKAVKDTLGLANYYEANKANYMWAKRVDATIYSCINAATAKKVKKLIRKKNKGKITDKEILLDINADSPLNLQIDANKFLKGNNKHIDAISWNTGLANDIVLEDGSFIVIDIHEVLPIANKLLEETKGKVIADYQDHLEKEWIASLREKYSVKVNKEVLYTLIK